MVRLESRKELKMENHYIKRLVACAIQFNEDYYNGGDISGLDNIRELIVAIKKTMDIPKAAKFRFDDIDTKCLIYRDICRKPETTDKECIEYFQDVRLDFVATCRTYGILDI